MAECASSSPTKEPSSGRCRREWADIVFAPLYRALLARGVRFRFFAKVTNLRLSADGRRVERIELLRQASPKSGDYQPLVKVEGIPSWPSEPLYDQLVEGEQLRKAGVNLESAWTTWTGEPLALAAGADFDDVLLGLSIAAAQDVCGDLAAAGGRFARMLSEIQTVQTAALQLWFPGDAASIGADPVPRIGSAYADVLNTWSDMTFLLPREQLRAPLRAISSTSAASSRTRTRFLRSPIRRSPPGKRSASGRPQSPG